MIAMTGIKKSYGTSGGPVTVLDGVDLEIARGEAIAMAQASRRWSGSSAVPKHPMPGRSNDR